ncbi:rod shape-determining protein MreC [Sphingomonas sp. PAMC 26621]|uniref:rod shape-determining protein MreC n=1 Tax=Sphingomonas sp. PAMC 26621 TaxID=1112213 RepID=UPI00028834DE|nr:rod shape-determining protein MreC [Sphingomonas sp. PAMC 26621]
MAPPRNRRPGFSRRAQYGLFLGYVIAVAGSLVAAVLLALSAIDPPAFAVLRATVAEVTTPMSSGLSAVGQWFGSIPGGIGSYVGVHDENKRLHKQLADQHALYMRARSLVYDNRRLTALLRLRERITEPVVTARLVSSSATSTRRFAVLNAGSWQGVASGQPVTGPDGLVGRVLETGPNSARVLLLTDGESVVPVRRTRDGLPALAAGRGDGLVDIRSVAMSNAGFTPGDVFVTSGIGGIYPPDVPVARVLRHGRDSAPARSYSQPDTLDYAMVQRAFMPPLPPTPVPVPVAKPIPAPKPSKSAKPRSAPDSAPAPAPAASAVAR